MPNTEGTKLYEVSVDRKDKETKDGQGYDLIFFVRDIGYKQAWTNSRAVCRLGSEHVHEDLRPFDKDGEPVAIQAGIYTVRKVFQADKKPAKGKDLTVVDLVVAAETKGIHVSNKLRELIDEMEPTFADKVEAAKAQASEAEEVAEGESTESDQSEVDETEGMSEEELESATNPDRPGEDAESEEEMETEQVA